MHAHLCPRSAPDGHTFTCRSPSQVCTPFREAKCLTIDKPFWAAFICGYCLDNNHDEVDDYNDCFEIGGSQMPAHKPCPRHLEPRRSAQSRGCFCVTPPPQAHPATPASKHAQVRQGFDQARWRHAESRLRARPTELQQRAPEARATCWGKHLQNLEILHQDQAGPPVARSRWQPVRHQQDADMQASKNDGVRVAKLQLHSRRHLGSPVL